MNVHACASTEARWPSVSQSVRVVPEKKESVREIIHRLFPVLRREP